MAVGYVALLNGMMSEAELHWLRSRLQGGKLTKAEQGQLRFRLPVGLLYDPVGRTVFDPDEAVQEAVRLGSPAAEGSRARALDLVLRRIRDPVTPFG